MGANSPTGSLARRSSALRRRRALPDGGWLSIEPALARPRWGASDRLLARTRAAHRLRGGRLGARSIGIPALAEPARLPPGRRHRGAEPHRRARRRPGAGPLAYRRPLPDRAALPRAARILPLRARASARSARRLHGRAASPGRRRRSERVFVGRRALRAVARADREGRRGAAAPTTGPTGRASCATRRAAFIDAADGVRCVAVGARRGGSRTISLLRPDGDLATILADEPPAAASRPLPAASSAGRRGGGRRAAAPRRWRPFVRIRRRGVLARVGAGRRATWSQIGRRPRANLRPAAAGARGARWRRRRRPRRPRARSGFAALAEMAALVGDALAGARAGRDARRAARRSAGGARAHGARRARSRRTRGDIAAAVEALLAEARR